MELPVKALARHLGHCNTAAAVTLRALAHVRHPPTRNSSKMRARVHTAMHTMMLHLPSHVPLVQQLTRSPFALVLQGNLRFPIQGEISQCIYLGN
jgi:hypothetical protein